MSEGNQIYLPESFTSLYVPPGKVKPSIGLRAMGQRDPLAGGNSLRMFGVMQVGKGVEGLHQLGIADDVWGLVEAGATDDG